MLDAFNLEGSNISPNLKKTIKLVTHFKLLIFLLFSILNSIWNLKVIDEQNIVSRAWKSWLLTDFFRSPVCSCPLGQRTIVACGNPGNGFDNL